MITSVQEEIWWWSDETACKARVHIISSSENLTQHVWIWMSKMGRIKHDAWIVWLYQWFSSFLLIRTARGAGKNSRHSKTILQDSNLVDPGWFPGIILTCVWWLWIRRSEKVTLRDTRVFYTHIQLEVIAMDIVYSDMATNLPKGSKKFSSIDSSRVSVWLILILVLFLKPYLKSSPCIPLVY